jgi:DNA-directed RNA polymerase specialized sigma24 family protein
MGDITRLIGRVKDGSSSAFADLMGRFYTRQVRHAQGRLGPDHAGVGDAEDVAALTFWELWRRLRSRGRLFDFLSDTPTLLRALATLTRNEVSLLRRNALRHCRDARRTVRIPDSPREEGAQLLGLATTRWRDAARAVESREELERLIGLLPQERHRLVVRLLLEGRPVGAIGRELRCSARTVQRLCLQIRDVWRADPRDRASLEGE